MKIDVFCYKIDVQMRPVRLSILCAATDSSDETQLMYSITLLCLFVS